MYQIPGYNNRRQRHAQRGREEDDMSQFLSMYQMFSPEQQAREQLLRAQAAQTEMENSFMQQTVDPRLAALDRAAQHEVLQQQQMQMQMDQASLLAPEQLRALKIQNDEGGKYGAKSDSLALERAVQMQRLAGEPQGTAYQIAQGMTPEMRSDFYKASPLAQMTPEEYNVFQKKVGPFGGGEGAPDEKLPHPVAVGRSLTEYMQKFPGLGNVKMSEGQKSALDIYKYYMGMPKEWDTDPAWLTRAQSADSIEKLEQLKREWEHTVFSAQQARENPSAYISSGFGGF